MFYFPVNLDHLDAIKAQREMFEALKARKEALDEKLRKKTGELRLLCLQEGVSFYHYCLLFFFFIKQKYFSNVAYVYINGQKH